MKKIKFQITVLITFLAISSFINQVKAAEDNSILYEYKSVNLTAQSPRKTLHFQINKATLLQQGDEGVFTAGNNFQQTAIKYTVRIGTFQNSTTIPQSYTNNQLLISVISKQQFEQNCINNFCELYIDIEAQNLDLTQETVSYLEYSTQVQLRFRTQNKWSSQKIDRHVQSQLVQKRDNIEDLQVFRYQYFNSKKGDQAVSAVSTNDFSDKNFKVMIKVLTNYDQPPMNLTEFKKEITKQPFEYSDAKVQLQCGQDEGCINVFDVYFYYSSESKKDQTWFFISTSQAYLSIPIYPYIGLDNHISLKYRPSQKYNYISLGLNDTQNQNIKLDFQYNLAQDTESGKTVGELSTLYFFYKDENNQLQLLQAYSDLKNKNLYIQNPVRKYSCMMISDPAFRNNNVANYIKVDLKNDKQDYIKNGTDSYFLSRYYENQFLIDVKNLTSKKFQIRMDDENQSGIYLSYLPYRKNQNNMIFPTINPKNSNNTQSNLPKGNQTDLGTNNVIDITVDNANTELLLVTMLNTNQESKSINLSLCDGICKPIVKPSKSNNNWWIIMLSIIGAIAIIGCIAFFLIKKKKKQSLQPESEYQNMQYHTDDRA